MTTVDDRLRSAWADDLAAVGAAVPGDTVLDALLARYREPQRAFHTVEHVAAVVSALMDASPLARLAGWYHDAVYDPTSATNEADSAALAVEELSALGADDAACARVAGLVLVTRTHEPPDGDADAMALCRADLAVLGARPDRYDAYVGAVRREYAHVDDAGWVTGRGAFLRSMLGRTRLVPGLMPAADDPLDRAARTNLARELAALERTA